MTRGQHNSFVFLWDSISKKKFLLFVFKYQEPSPVDLRDFLLEESQQESMALLSIGEENIIC